MGLEGDKNKGGCFGEDLEEIEYSVEVDRVFFKSKEHK